jgi:hypothetical protein
MNALGEMGKTPGAKPFDLGGTAEEVVAVVEDLTWALMRPIYGDGTRVLHLFQTPAFPAPRGLRVPFDVPTLSRANLFLRRSILAVIACVLKPGEFYALGQSSPYLGLPSTCFIFLKTLGDANTATFVSKAHRWPPDFRHRMQWALHRPLQSTD